MLHVAQRLWTHLFCSQKLGDPQIEPKADDVITWRYNEVWDLWCISVVPALKVLPGAVEQFSKRGSHAPPYNHPCLLPIKQFWCLSTYEYPRIGRYTAPQSKNAVCALQINCKLLPSPLDKSYRNEQTINSLS